MSRELPSAPCPLEPPRALAEAWLASLSHFAHDQIEGLEQAAAGGPGLAEALRTADQVSRPVSEDPLPGGLPAIIALLERATTAALCAPGPGYLAYIPGGGIYTAALADFVADCLNRYTGMPAPAPALFRLEQDVLRWLCAAFGYGPAARAVLTPGSSLAMLSAVVAARHARLGDDGDLRGAVAYTSAQAHHSVAKAIRLAGIPPRNLRSVAVDDQFRLRPDDLDQQVSADLARGLRPFLLVATAGSTNTGAIDPLPALAQLCSQRSMWLHVDAAYGGAFVLTPTGRDRLVGIDRADSIAFDPHKGLFLPYGTGCLLARDGEALRRAHHLGADYLQDLTAADPASGPSPPEAPGSWSPAELGPELSRDFRGLRLWLPLMMHGAGAFREALAEKLDLAQRFCDGLDRLAGRGLHIEVVARPQLSLTAFRLARGPGEALTDWNQRNRSFLLAINARQRVHLSSTLLPVADGQAFTLRVCVLSFRTHARHVDRCLEDVEGAL
jgi:aromatic-L-amino-acid/L-tryptophan decarboxylase